MRLYRLAIKGFHQKELIMWGHCLTCIHCCWCDHWCSAWSWWPSLSLSVLRWPDHCRITHSWTSWSQSQQPHRGQLGSHTLWLRIERLVRGFLFSFPHSRLWSLSLGTGSGSPLLLTILKTLPDGNKDVVKTVVSFFVCPAVQCYITFHRQLISPHKHNFPSPAVLSPAGDHSSSAPETPEIPCLLFSPPARASLAVLSQTKTVSVRVTGPASESNDTGRGSTPGSGHTKNSWSKKINML